jgi:ABC-type multidrug transport system ATPase subunit
MEEVRDADRVVVLDKGKIIAEDTPLGLKNRFTSSKLIWYTDRGADKERVLEGMESDYDGDHYTVTVYWCWPATFSRMTLGRGDKLFASPLFETAETRAPMIADVKAHHEKYFYDYDESEIDFDDPDYPNTYYVYLSEGYNRGDQFIGDHVHYLVVVANVADSAPEEP